MEKLNADEKMLVVMKLDPKEVVIVCEASKEINSVCKNSKYDLLWQNKIKEDFNVKTQGSYEMYKFLKQLYEKTFYMVSVINEYLPDSFTKIFDSEEKAEKYIYSQLGGIFSYSAMKTALITESLKYGSNTYRLEEVEMNKEKTLFDDSFIRERKEYEKDREELEKLDDKMSILGTIEDCITDFNSDFTGGNISSMPTAKSKIRSYVKEIDEEFELGDKKETIKNLIINNLFVDNKTKELLRK